MPEPVSSAIAHGNHPDHNQVLRALMTVLVDDDLHERYADLVVANLPEAARHYLEQLMTTEAYEYKSDFARRFFSKGRAEGEAKGEAKALLTMLEARGIEISNDARTRITECTDLDQLNTWVRRAVTVDSTTDLFN